MNFKRKPGQTQQPIDLNAINAQAVQAGAAQVHYTLNQIEQYLKVIMNSIGGFVYAMKRENPKMFENYKTGMMVNNLLNIKLEKAFYESQSTDNNPVTVTKKFEYLMELEKSISELEKQIEERGLEFLIEANQEYEKLLAETMPSKK